MLVGGAPLFGLDAGVDFALPLNSQAAVALEGEEGLGLSEVKVVTVLVDVQEGVDRDDRVAVLELLVYFEVGAVLLEDQVAGVEVLVLYSELD